MLTELFERILREARETVDVTQHAANHDPRKSYVRLPGGDVKEHDVEPPLRRWILGSLVDVIEIAQNTALAPRPGVFFDSDCVTVVLDMDDRREWASMTLRRSVLYQSLIDLRVADAPGLLLRKLRAELPGAVPSTLLEALSDVKFSSVKKAQHATSSREESLGREVEQAVDGSVPMPEGVQCLVRPWSDRSLAGIVTPISITVLVDHDAQAVRLIAHPDAERDSMALALENLSAVITAALSKEVPVIGGSFPMDGYRIGIDRGR